MLIYIFLVIVLTNNATEVNSATEIQQYAADDRYVSYYAFSKI